MEGSERELLLDSSSFLSSNSEETKTGIKHLATAFNNPVSAYILGTICRDGR